ncbi:MAG: sigma-70 family RNA polymerase sigma factor [Methylocystis sp.]|uniref:sigma-70 family RNA polymerase sigma factor n=1 Tax=Methylocystis sp. TaxID=1911079 RepID=UPI0039349987
MHIRSGQGELSDTSNDREIRWRALMAASQDGDHAAYAELLSDLFPVLRRFVMRRWPHAHDTEDVVQEILASIHSVRQTYDRQRPFTPWLMTIAARRVADFARSRYARANETTVDVLPETFPDDGAKSEQEASDDREALSRAMATLPASQRQAIELIKLRGLSLDEAAQVTGKSVGALKVGVHRAIKAMRQALERDG